jgi:proteasome assembly chaperone (PAC2) family protein
MFEGVNDVLRIHECPVLDQGTLVLALSGWMDGGDVSTGTVQRLVDLLGAQPIAEIDPEPFYIYNFPGSMEVAALFRPHIRIEDGQVASCDLPRNTFFCHESANLLLFIGREPNLRWRAFGDCIVELAHRVGIRHVVFVGSFGGAVPHTREPRLYVTCSEARLLSAMERYGLRRSGYKGPGSFASYLMTRAPSSNLEMTSLVAEIPGYLQGRNPTSIEAVTRRLAKILKLPLELKSLRAESTAWELEVSRVVEQDRKLAKTIHELEEAYDNSLLEQEGASNE